MNELKIVKILERLALGLPIALFDIGKDGTLKDLPRSTRL
jgi:hypothetical protein